MIHLNETHDQSLKSWVKSANEEGGDFPIQNLPYSSFRKANSDEEFRVGVAIGDKILDLVLAGKTNLFDGLAMQAITACSEKGLNGLMALQKGHWGALRSQLSKILSDQASDNYIEKLTPCLFNQNEAEYSIPCKIGDYTDFYTSVYHATTVGSLFRPDNPLLPNYKWVPIGYHGRASSIVASGMDFIRPCGQIKKPDESSPIFGPAQRLDYELELGVFIGTGNNLGEPINIDDAEDHVFGICLLNDWSARDFQAWEYQPLGPFLSKNFFSSLSPWVVTLEALAPFRAQWSRDENDPQPLEYLDSESIRTSGAIDISLEVFLESDKHRETEQQATKLSSTNYSHSYWTISQMVTHHTVNGCNLQPGDLLGSGTQSGPTLQEAGSMLELSLGGKEKIILDTGEERTFLEDGDKVIFNGWCEKQGFRRIGFGEVSGTVLPCKK